MGKYLKRMTGVFMAVTLCMGLSLNVLAAEETISPYEAVLNEINEEYELDLGYVEVDASKVTLEEYEETTRNLAASQRELLDYIESREYSEEEYTESIARASVVKTKAKPTWELGQFFQIRATYTITNNSSISLCRNAEILMTNAAILSNTYLTNISAPTYGHLDAGRTSTVKYTAHVHFDSVIYSNVTLYTEFYYTD